MFFQTPSLYFYNSNHQIKGIIAVAKGLNEAYAGGSELKDETAGSQVGQQEKNLSAMRRGNTAMHFQVLLGQFFPPRVTCLFSQKAFGIVFKISGVLNFTVL